MASNRAEMRAAAIHVLEQHHAKLVIGRQAHTTTARVPSPCARMLLYARSSGLRPGVVSLLPLFPVIQTKFNVFHF